MFARRWIDKPERLPNVIRQDQNEQERQIEKIAMHILHDERERMLAPVTLTRLSHRARWRIGPKRFVVSAAIIITGEPEATRCPKNKKRRRKDEPGGPPCRLRSKPTVWRITKQFGRIKRRNVIAKEIIFSLKRRPRGVDDESRQPDKNEQRLDPPNIRAHRLAERAARKSCRCRPVHLLENKERQLGQPSKHDGWEAVTP